MHWAMFAGLKSQVFSSEHNVTFESFPRQRKLCRCKESSIISRFAGRCVAFIVYFYLHLFSITCWFVSVLDQWILVTREGFFQWSNPKVCGLSLISGPIHIGPYGCVCCRIGIRVIKSKQYDKPTFFFYSIVMLPALALLSTQQQLKKEANGQISMKHLRRIKNQSSSFLYRNFIFLFMTLEAVKHA